MIRKSLRPDYYPPYTPGKDGGEDLLFGHRHIGHCVEVIRQALMCSADVTPYTWEWNEKLQLHANKITTPHTCRNFDKIRDWAVENNGDVSFDATYRELNDPLNPDTWVNGYTGE
jgi:hypothetical protein